MNEIIIYGIPGSPFLRSLALTLEEKELPYQIKNIGMGGNRHPDYLAKQPFGKIPVITHGDFTLYETQAMIRYVNRLKDEPNLVPDDPRAEARMNQVIGISDWYVFPGPSAGIGFHRVVAPKFGMPADEAKVAATIEPARTCLGALSAILRDQKFFAGDQISLADLHLFPHLEFLSLAAPEGPALLAEFPSLTAWLTRMQSRPSVQATTWEAMTAKAKAA
jgi:glutathione S-transferase